MSFDSSSYAAVFFDCDGVLVDSEALAASAIYQSLMDVGLSMTLEEVNAHYIGQSFRTCLGMIEAQLGHAVPDDFIDNNRHYYWTLMEKELVAMPDVAGVLASLTIPYAVVTNSQTRELEFKLRKTNLETYFPVNIRFDTESVGVAKPDPEIYLRAAAGMGVDIKQCLIIEDSLPGLTAAVGSGATVWAYRPHPSQKELQAMGVERIFTQWSEF
jgi:HAD superfamily hydrolase (TIGR01509 family)